MPSWWGNSSKLCFNVFEHTIKPKKLCSISTLYDKDSTVFKVTRTCVSEWTLSAIGENEINYCIYMYNYLIVLVVLTECCGSSQVKPIVSSLFRSPDAELLETVSSTPVIR